MGWIINIVSVREYGRHPLQPHQESVASSDLPPNSRQWNTESSIIRQITPQVRLCHSILWWIEMACGRIRRSVCGAVVTLTWARGDRERDGRWRGNYRSGMALVRGLQALVKPHCSPWLLYSRSGCHPWDIKMYYYNLGNMDCHPGQGVLQCYALG